MKTMLDAWIEKTKANREEKEPVEEQQEVPKEGAAVETIKALEDRCCRMPLTAEETYPGQWWVPAEVGHYPRTVDLLRSSCTAQGIRLSGTRKGCCSTWNPWRTDVHEEMLGVI
jgi:hypothetical protein